ncbi:MAG: hypothetical protein IJ840_09385 [Bacteroidales bacterium]|nr:hypothetical protein [Bacteroidales bacterium]
MITALIIAVTVAIIFIALFIDERGTVKEYKNPAQATPAQPGQAVMSRPTVDDQDLWDLTPDLVVDVVKYNGYVPDRGEDGVLFMIQGERYFVPTDMLPCVAIMKRFNISEGNYDIALMREATRKTTESRWMGKCGLSDDGKTLIFFTASLEHKYGHFRDVFNDSVSVVNDIENLFGETYNKMFSDKSDLKKLEANGIEIPPPSSREGKIVS